MEPIDIELDVGAAENGSLRDSPLPYGRDENIDLSRIGMDPELASRLTRHLTALVAEQGQAQLQRVVVERRGDVGDAVGQRERGEVGEHGVGRGGGDAESGGESVAAAEQLGVVAGADLGPAAGQQLADGVIDIDFGEQGARGGIDGAGIDGARGSHDEERLLQPERPEDRPVERE